MRTGNGVSAFLVNRMDLVDRQTFIVGLGYTLNRRKFLMAGTFLVVFALFMFAGYLITPTWTAETLLLAEPAPKPLLTPFPDATVGGASLASDTAQNLVLLLGSKGLSYEIVKEFKLDERQRRKAQEPATFREKTKLAVGKTLSFPARLPEIIGLREREEIDWIDKADKDFREGLLSWLDAKALPNSQVVSIKINGETPTLATDIANAMVVKARQRLARAAAAASQDARDTHQRELERIKAQLDDAEQELRHFQEEQGGVVLNEQSRLNTLRYTELSGQFARLDSEVSLLESQVVEIASDPARAATVNSATLADSEVIRDLRTLLHAQTIELAGLRTERTSRHPDVKNLEAEIARLGLGLRDALITALNGLKTDRERIKGELKVVEATLLRLPAQELRLAELALSAETQRGLYRELLRTTEQLEVLANSGVASIDFTVLDNAYVSPLSSSDIPSWFLILAIALVMGAVLSVGLVLFLEYWRDPVKSPLDMQRHGVEVLAVVPKVK
jgi:succinoglycan biosynthesis transport protein ExoP